MKYNLLLIVTTAIICGCSAPDPKMKDIVVVKSAIDIENESLSTGIRSDTLIKGFYFGMTKRDVYQHVEMLSKNREVYFNKDSTINCKDNLNTHVRFHFYNGELFRTVEKITRSFKNDVLTNLNYKFGASLKNGTQPSKSYWLKGNLRVDYFEEGDNIFTSYSDIKTERLMMSRIENIDEDIAEIYKSMDEKIMQILTEKAKKDNPDNYVVQDFWINEQFEAYEYMKSVPNINIKKKVVRDNPNDYVIQKYWYDKQTKAQKRIK